MKRLPLPLLPLLALIPLLTAGCYHTVTARQLRQEEDEHIYETVDWWYYMGSEDGYHYFRQVHTLGSGTYRVRESELALTRTIPLTGDKRKWVPLPLGTTALSVEGVDHSLLPPSMLAYPYIAPAPRQQRIMDGYRQMRIGISEKDVLSLMGEPDEKNPTYEPKIRGPIQIGFSYVYVIQRLKASGSVNEMQEKLLRIQFDQAGSVTRVDPVGIPNLSCSGPEQDRNLLSGLVASSITGHHSRTELKL